MRTWRLLALMRIWRLVAVPGLGILLLLGIALGWADVYRPVSTPDLSDVARLQAENRALRIELELAARPGPYLVVDLAAGSLTLKSHGVPLRSFEVRRAELRSARRLGFRGRPLPALDTAWDGGVLLPVRPLNRVVIESDTVSPPDRTGTVSFIPPTPEEEHPVRPLFRVRFAGGLSAFIEADPDPVESAGPTPAESAAVAPAGATGPAPGVAAAAPPMGRIRRFTAWLAMRPWRREPARLRLVLPAADAGALYRAYTDGTPLLLVGWP